MKVKSIIAVAILLMAGMTAQAQVRLGLKAGLDASMASSRPYNPYNFGDQWVPHNDFVGGFTSQFQIADRVVGIVDLLYDNRGYVYIKKKENSWLGINAKYKMDLYNIVLPIYGGYQMLDDRFILGLGVEPGITVYARDVLEAPEYDEKVILDRTDAANTFNIGMGLLVRYYFTDDFGIDFKIAGTFTDMLKGYTANSIYMQLGAFVAFEL